MGAWENEPAISFDEQGTLLYAYAAPIGKQRNPVTTAQYAIVCFDRYLATRNETYRRKFLAQARSLASMAERNGEGDRYPYSFDYPRYGLKKPWFSALAQGHAASVFVRAYALTGDPKYVDASRRALVPLTKPVAEGGLLAKTPEGHDWLEEYPSQKPSLVLNGFVFALIGLLEHQKIDPGFPDPAWTTGLIASLKSTIHFYEQDGWLLYDRDQAPKVSDNYMGLQILQMYQMFDLTGDRWFLDKAASWEKSYEWSRFFKAWRYPEQPLTHRRGAGAPRQSR